MNVTFVLTAVSQNVRRSLTRWAIEFAPSVFVGTMSARVRDELWDVVQDSTDSGWSLLIYSDSNEQGFSVRVCGEERRHILDLDGLCLSAIKSDHLVGKI